MKQESYIKIYKNEPERTVTKENGYLDVFAKELYKDAANHTSRKWIERVWKNVIDLRDVYDNELNSIENINRSFRPPTLQNIIDGLMDSKHQARVNTVYEPIDKDDSISFRKALALTKARDCINEESNKKLAEDDAWQHAFTEGTGYMYKGYHRLVTENHVKYDNIVHISIDPRSLFPDPNATQMHDPTGYSGARYVFWHRRMNYSTWITNTQNNPQYKNQFSVRVSVDSTTQYHSNEEDAQGDFGRVMLDVYEMWNPELEWTYKGKNMKGVHAIFTSLQGDVTEHFIEEWDKDIPIVPYYAEKRDDSFYGIPPALKLAPLIIQKDTLINLALKGIKMETQSPIVVDKEAGYNAQIHKVSPNAIWELKNDQRVPIQNLITRAPFQAVGMGDMQMFNTMLDDELTIASSVDRRALFLSPNELATQTRAKQESALKRMARLIKHNIRRAEKKSAEIELGIIKDFLAKKKKLFDKKGNVVERYRKMKVRGYIAVTSGLLGKEVPDLVPTMAQAPSMYELTEDLFDIDYNVVIKDEVEKVGMDEDTRGRLLQFYQLKATNPTPEAMEELKQLEVKILESLNISKDEVFKEKEITTDSPLMKQLEIIAYGGEPVEEEEETQGQTLKRLEELLEFQKTKRFKELTHQSQVKVSNLVTRAMEKLRKPAVEKQAQPQIIPPQMGTMPKMNPKSPAMGMPLPTTNV